MTSLAAETSHDGRGQLGHANGQCPPDDEQKERFFGEKRVQLVNFVPHCTKYYIN